MVPNRFFYLEGARDLRAIGLAGPASLGEDLFKAREERGKALVVALTQRAEGASGARLLVRIRVTLVEVLHKGDGVAVLVRAAFLIVGGDYSFGGGVQARLD